MAFSKVKITLRPWAVPGPRLRVWVTTTSTTVSTSTTTDPNNFDSTTSNPSTTTTTYYLSTTTTPPLFGDPGAPTFTPYPGSATRHLLHTKFWPKYNDNKFISHADDRVRKQGTATSSLAELALSPPHESTGHPIGSAIESYQGFKTVEVWIRQIHIGIPEDMDLNYACTDYMPGSLIYPGHPYHPNKGDVIVQAWNSDEDNPDGAGTGLWQQLYYERPIEELKVIEWETTGSSEFQLDFYFRAAMNSPFHHRVSSFVHVAWHDSCGPQDPCP